MLYSIMTILKVSVKGDNYFFWRNAAPRGQREGGRSAARNDKFCEMPRSRAKGGEFEKLKKERGYKTKLLIKKKRDNHWSKFFSENNSNSRLFAPKYIFFGVSPQAEKYINWGKHTSPWSSFLKKNNFNKKKGNENEWKRFNKKS